LSLIRRDGSAPRKDLIEHNVFDCITVYKLLPRLPRTKSKFYIHKMLLRLTITKAIPHRTQGCLRRAHAAVGHTSAYTINSGSFEFAFISTIMANTSDDRDMPSSRSQGLGLEKLDSDYEESASRFSSSLPSFDMNAAINTLKRCEDRYKTEITKISRNLRTFFETHLDPSSPSSTDKVLESMYSDYNLTIFSHSLIGGAFGYVLARSVTTRLIPSSRLFAVVSFTGLSSMLAASAATSLATTDLVKKAMEVVTADGSNKEGTQKSWPYLLTCRPVVQLKECVDNGPCRDLLLGGKVQGGVGFVQAYHQCRRRADLWATQDEFLAIQEEEGLRGVYEDEEELESENTTEQECSKEQGPPPWRENDKRKHEARASGDSSNAGQGWR